MRSYIPLFFGIFIVMALSNAIVPVLPSYAAGSALQGAIYSAYFLGAFLSTLPAGILSDRYGRLPLLRAGILLTLTSGILIIAFPQPLVVIVSRFVEGIGGGCFVAVAMAYVNSLPDHQKKSGILMALLNAGLVTGLALSGFLAVYFLNPADGIIVFTSLCIFPALLLLLNREPPHNKPEHSVVVIGSSVRNNAVFWYSSIILVGITGIVASLYPQFSGMPPDLVGIWIAAMSVSTIASVLIASRVTWQPKTVIRWSAVLMSLGAGVAFYSPVGFIIIGAIAGFVMIAVMAVLSGQQEKQGILMGLFSTSSYLGMALLPFSAGLVADRFGFAWAFTAAAVLSLTVALAIGSSSPDSSNTHPEK
jgi:MFS family permease